ncbi:hypothetical protein LINPERPRIM_LOCUS24092 [Linum perenne]
MTLMITTVQLFIAHGRSTITIYRLFGGFRSSTRKIPFRPFLRGLASPNCRFTSLIIRQSTVLVIILGKYLDGFGYDGRS